MVGFARNTPIFSLLFFRFVRERYLGNLFGPVWVIVVPLAQLAIYAYVFVEVFKAKVPEAEMVGFVPFLAVAFWPWLAFAEGVQRASSSLLDNRDLLGKIAMPMEVLPSASLSAAFALHLAGYLAVLLVLAVAGTQFHWGGAGIVLLTLVTIYLIALSLGLLLSALSVYFTDIQHALGPLFMLWFFATPILYSPTLIPESIRPYSAINPLHFLVGRLRDGLLRGESMPGISDVVAVLVACGVFYLSLIVFRRSARRIHDYL